MNILRPKYKSFRHKLTARHSYGFGVHSPFLFSFTKFVIYEKHPFYVFRDVEALCKKRVAQKRVDLSANRDLEAQAKFELSPRKRRERQLLYRIVKDLKARTVLEIGSAEGISTLYLALAHPEVLCSTIVATAESAGRIKKSAELFDAENINIFDAQLKDALAQFTEENKNIDLIFINPSVSDDSILTCFEHCLPFIHNNSVFIFSDMYRSKAREQLWKTITKNKEITAYLDTYSFGMLFFKKDLIKKKYKMRF